MLAWLGIVLSAAAWLLTAELAVPPRPDIALVLAAVAAACILGGAGILPASTQPKAALAEGRAGILPVLRRVLLTLVLLVGILASQCIFHAAYWRTAPYYRAAFAGPLIAGSLRALGVDAAATMDFHPDPNRGLDAGPTAADPLVAIQTLNNTTLLRPSLERFGAYPLGHILAGGLVLCAVAARRPWRALLALVLIIPLYALVRIVLLALLSSETQLPATFWNPWAVLASLLPLVPLLGTCIPRLCVNHTNAAHAITTRSMRQRPILVASVAVLAAVGGAGLTLVAFGESQGERKQGRILINDLHSGFWEVTTGVFDEEAFGERTIYTYTSLRDWLAEFYDVRVNTDQPITDTLLTDVDVFLLKTPLQPILPSEREAILRFVERGGGLWLHGDHTNLFGMSTFLNPVAADYGFFFRHDDTFDLISNQPTVYTPPRFGRHPAMARVPQLTLQTTCTVSAPLTARPVMIGPRMGSEIVDYGHTNFFGNIKTDPEDDFGIWLITAATQRGAGRVLAFGDSTIFSNFTMFLPGIPDFAIASVEYLNHHAAPRTPLIIAGWVGLAALIAALAAAALARTRWIVIGGVLGLLAGYAAAGTVLTRQATAATPVAFPPDRTNWAVMDQTLCSYRVPSSLEYEVFDSDRSYDAFYLNLVRLGLRPRFGSGIGRHALPAGVRIFLLPTRPPTAAQLRELRTFVEGGGKIAIFESSQYIAPATKNLLAALDIEVSGGGGHVQVVGAEPVAIARAARPRTPNTVTLHLRKLGDGRVLFISGAEWFNRRYQGQVYKTPDPLEREWYRLQFHVFHVLRDGPAEESAP